MVSAPPSDPAALHVAARAAALYLLSVTAVASASLAWSRSAAGVVAVAGWALALAGALVAGELAAPALVDAQRTWRARGRIAASVAYATVVFLGAMAASGAPSPSLLARLTLLAAAVQVVALVVAGGIEDPALAVANAYALTALAALRGGAPASVAALVVPLAHSVFLAHDHAARTLSLYGARRGPAPRAVWRAWARQALLPLVALAAWLVAVPPRPYAGVRWDAEASEGAPGAAWRLLAIVALIGSAGVYALGQFLRRRRRRDAPVEEVIESALLEDEAGELAFEGGASAGAGPRGRVVRVYLDFLRRAARLGWARRPDWTPLEFAGILRAPADPLARLTRAFMDARYGQADTADAEADAAEAAAGQVLAELGRRRERGRPARTRSGR